MTVSYAYPLQFTQQVLTTRNFSPEHIINMPSTSSSRSSGSRCIALFLGGLLTTPPLTAVAEIPALPTIPVNQRQNVTDAEHQDSAAWHANYVKSRGPRTSLPRQSNQHMRKHLTHTWQRASLSRRRRRNVWSVWTAIGTRRTKSERKTR